MIRVAVLAGTIALSGCASVGETMAGKEPSLVANTLKTPSAFRDCIVNSAAFAEFSVTDRGRGHLFVHNKAPGQIIEVQPGTEGSSQVTVWGLLGTRKTARACI